MPVLMLIAKVLVALHLLKLTVEVRYVMHYVATPLISYVIQRMDQTALVIPSRQHEDV